MLAISPRLGVSPALLPLDDPQLVQALQLVETHHDALVPNLAGVLMLGREASIARLVPTHQVAFQVLDARSNVLLNDWFGSPLLRTLESIEERFMARNQEQEIQVGLTRLPVPAYSLDAFREAVNNAVSHRDYTRLGAVHIQMHPGNMQITNPGGFLEGITLDNLLVHEPKPRNPRLAEVFRRVGLVETTGRGIDKIYMGQLRYGRSLPDYTQSDREAIRLTLSSDADLAFAAFVYERDSAGAPLDLDELLVLHHLRTERRIDVETAGLLTQRGPIYSQALLERLVKRGFVDVRNEKHERFFYLSTSLHQRIGLLPRTLRPDPAEQENMVLRYIDQYSRITRHEVRDLLNLTDRQARSLLARLIAEGKLRLHSASQASFYTRL